MLPGKYKEYNNLATNNKKNHQKNNAKEYQENNLNNHYYNYCLARWLN